MQAIQSSDDAIIQLYYAGLITKFATLTIYGTGAERGTWGRFANICLDGITSTVARDALTYFTDIYSTALRNRGNTRRKRKFYLSQLQEINPLIDFFGLQDVFNDAWDTVKQFDSEHSLQAEYSSKGRIQNWEERTIRLDINFSDHEELIMDALTAQVVHSFQVQDIPELTFMEGLRGYSIGVNDLTLLREGRSILDRYAQVA